MEKNEEVQLKTVILRCGTSFTFKDPKSFETTKKNTVKITKIIDSMEVLEEKTVEEPYLIIVDGDQYWEFRSSEIAAVRGNITEETHEE